MATETIAKAHNEEGRHSSFPCQNSAGGGDYCNCRCMRCCDSAATPSKVDASLKNMAIKGIADRCACVASDGFAVELRSTEGASADSGSSKGGCDGRYGWRRYAPDWLQRLSAPGSFLAFLCWLAFVQSFPINGLTIVNASTIERRFRLSSTQTGLISSAYDIVGGLVVLPISYYGGRGHKPRYLGVASLLIAAGCLVIILPHVLAGRYLYGGGSSGSLLPIETVALPPWPSSLPSAEAPAGSTPAPHAVGGSLCDGSSGNGTAQITSSDDCRDDNGGSNGSEDSQFFYVFLVGMALIGCGGVTLYTVGTVFIDENVPTDRASLFTGIFFGFTSLGSAAGFLAGSRFLTVYVDTPAEPPTQLLTQEDPQWVGAWWMGHAINVGLAVFLSLFLFGFPRELPSARETRKTRVSEAHHRESEAHKRAISDPTFGASIRDVPAATVLLLRNPVFVCVTLAGVVDSLVQSGFAQFFAKLLQNQFNQTASWSAMLAGFIVVPAATGGSILGGWLPRRLGLRVPGLILLCLLSSTAITVLSASVWMRCDVDIIAGVTAPYHEPTITRNGSTESSADSAAAAGVGGRAGIGLLNSPCNKHCECNTAAYEPVCGSDGLQYFSACHAGCTGSGTQAGALLNCSCVSSAAAWQDATSTVAAVTAGQATVGKCRIACPQLYGFLALMFVAVGAVFVKLTPWTTISMRIVPESQRTYAVGVQWMLLRLVGFAPGPIMFGAIIDAACVVWQNGCGANANRGSCWLYRGRDMSANVFSAMVALKLASVVLYACAYKLYRPPPDGRAATPAEAPPEARSSDVSFTCDNSSVCGIIENEHTLDGLTS